MAEYLRIHGVSKSFGQGRSLYTALSRIDLDIRHGEFVSIIGHSGCGKSTLLNLISGLERPTGGSLTLEGASIAGPGPERGMVFQHHGLLPWLSVQENVFEAVDAVFPSMSKEQKARDVEQVLRMVGLWEHRQKKPHQISGGMKQRTSIARAFAVHPKVLLLDEPFAALDALLKPALHDALVELWSSDGQSETVVMVTHDIDEAIFLSDRIVVMTDGPAATIREIVDVGLERPRDKRAMVHSPVWADLKDHLLSLLSEDRAAHRVPARKIKIGFMPLTDAASVIVAKEKGLFQEHGLDVDIVKQASWAGLRDGLLTGQLQAAHMLFSMPFSVYTGVGGPAGSEIQIAMVLNNNGQGITLADHTFSGRVGFRDTARLDATVSALKGVRDVTFAMTFPGGTHDIWLRYWLAAAGVPQDAVKIIAIPPAQMLANMTAGNLDGYSVGEPWNGIGVKEGIGFTAIASQDIWQDHPEKALGVNKEFAAARRSDLRLVMRAILEASQYVDEPRNKPEVARIIGQAAYMNTTPDVIDARLEGRYDLGRGLGQHQYTEDTMLFFNSGKVNLPRRAHALWFMAQYVRFGYLREMPPDAEAIADKLILTDLYREVATEMRVPIPDDDMNVFTIKLDNATFDPGNPQVYLGVTNVAERKVAEVV